MILNGPMCDFEEVSPGMWKCPDCGAGGPAERKPIGRCRGKGAGPQPSALGPQPADLHPFPPDDFRPGPDCGLPPVFVMGYPGDVGGAGAECWHAVKLWRRSGLRVTLVPMGPANARWRARLDRIGCATVETSPETLGDVPGLAGATVVAVCNEHFLRNASTLRDLGCRLVWAGCMCWLFDAERRHYRARGPFDAYVFQSEYQRKCLAGELALLGVPEDRFHLVRGALDMKEIPFAPRARADGEPFTIGRLSRADPAKFSVQTWEVLRRVAVWPKRARVLGWSDKVQAKLGAPPEWAEVLPPGAEPATQFLQSLHAMVQINGGAQENWPRSGLEAMAAGVPVVVQNQWGWREMIEHERTGFLCSDCPSEIAYWTGRLGRDEEFRQRIARQARARVEELTNPETIWAAWRSIFERLAVQTRQRGPVGGVSDGDRARESRESSESHSSNSRHLRAVEKTLIIGLGTGRCGTMSLARLLNAQPDAAVTHETSPALPWEPRAEHLASIRARVETLLARPARFVGDVALYYLSYIPAILGAFPAARVLVLQRDRAETVASYLRWMDGKYGPGADHWRADRPGPDKFGFDGCYPVFPPEAGDRAERIGLFWDLYYARARELSERSPENVRIFPTDALNHPESVAALLDWARVTPASRSIQIIRANRCPPTPATLAT